MKKSEKTLVGDVTSLISGVSYKPSDARDSCAPGYVPVLRAHNIQKDGINYDNLVYVSESRISPKQHLRNGDIVICASSGSKHLVGKAAQVKQDFGCSFGVFCKVIRPNKVFPAYLGHYFQSEEYRNEISELSAGANINNIKSEHLNNLQLPFPPEDTQKFISKIIDIVSEMLHLRNQQLTDLDILVKSRFVEMFGDPLTKDIQWPTMSLKSACRTILGGGTPSKSRPEYYSGETPWVTPKDMKSLRIDDSQDHITEDAILNSTTKLVPAESVLMVIRSGILKRTLPVAINTKPVAINQDMKAFIPKNTVYAEYLLYYFKAIETDVLGGVRSFTADNIDFKVFQNRSIPVPPIGLQREFTKFSQQTDKSKFAIQQSITELTTLKQALMQKYFGSQQAATT